MDADSVEHGRWWGSALLAQGETHRWRIGPTALWIQHLESEWRVAVKRDGDGMAGGLESERLDGAADLLELGEVQRFAVSGKTEELHLDPVLADRAIVTRPETPFQVPAGEKVTVFVSSPVWLRISIGSPPRPLLEEPIFRPSDTWFGANTLDGEVCYASIAHFVLNAGNVPVAPHRATTPVHIHNKAKESLELDRVRLPVTNLSLYETEDGRLLTNSATLERKEADEFAELRLGKRGPSGMGAMTRVAEPRLPESENPVVRAFSKLLQGW